jgi:hypothetical protein
MHKKKEEERREGEGVVFPFLGFAQIEGEEGDKGKGREGAREGEKKRGHGAMQ